MGLSSFSYDALESPNVELFCFTAGDWKRST